MIHPKTINRIKGTIETFEEDASVLSDNSLLSVTTMSASVTSGNSVSINSQTYENESLLFQVNFSQAGYSTVKVETQFSGSDEKQVTIWRFRTLDDGTNSPFTDYV